MIAVERQDKIMDLLMKNKTMSVKELCSLLDASEATIRRDLTFLESEKRLERTHGGAHISDRVQLLYEQSVDQKGLISLNEKRRIAQRAFEMIKNGESIVLDAGTTTLELAKLIGESKIQLLVITNGAAISNLICKNENIELYLTGGRVRHNTLASVGTSALELLKSFNVNKAFIGVNGITIDDGLTTPDYEEAQIKKTMLSIASERIVLADSTKFNKVARCLISPISAVDTIITDDVLGSNDFDMLREKEINVERV